MDGLEIALLVIGLVVIVASFIFSTKADGPETVKSNGKVELDDRQKEDLKKQILSMLDDEIDEVKDKTEVELDKLSNQKMLEMNEYSDTILSEINRNHNEVMFLYDMLNEKKKEVNIAVRDINIAKKEITSNVKEEQPEAPKAAKPAPKKRTTVKTMPVIPPDIDDDAGFMASEAKIKSETNKKADILNQLDAAFDAVSDDIPADDDAVVKKTRKKSTGKTAAKRLKETVAKESERENQHSKATVTNNNERILELASKGMSQVDIAKTLGIGTGEVKLVIDLFRGDR